MTKLFTAGCVLLTILPARAQIAEEQEFLEEAAAELDEYASLCMKNGFPERARQVWLEVISEYDTDHAQARERLGFARVGRSWAPVRGFRFPIGEEPSASNARNLQRRWDSLAESLGERHRDLATELVAAGLAERARYHFNRTLRFIPDDEVAAEARNLESFEGFWGTPEQVRMLRRSRSMERQVAELLAREYEVQELPLDRVHPWLQRAGIDHRGVRSEHFTVWGDWPVETLIEAVTFSERALDFCEDTFAGYEGFPPAAGIGVTHIYLRDRDSMVKVIEENRHMFGGVVDFLTRYEVFATFSGEGRARTRISGYGELEPMMELAVRWVASDYSGFRTPGLIEGIGHTVVARFFGRILVYQIAPAEDERTVASRDDTEPLQPDIDSWGKWTLESAWNKSAPRASLLPLVEFSAFSEEMRLKAWSFSDYLLRRDPSLLRFLDRSVTRTVRNEREVIGRFEELAGRSLLQLDEDWRRFWTEDTPLNRALHDRRTPLEAVNPAATAWLASFNQLRAMHGRPEVGWSSSLSAACQQHVEYLKANRDQRGPDAENTQDPQATGFSNRGRAFARTAIVSTKGSNPASVMRDWTDLPGFRDAILNPALRIIGLYVDGSIAVMDVQREWRRSPTTAIQSYPGPERPAPVSIDVKSLGSDFEGLVRRRSGGRRRSEIGYPISVHFYRAAPKGEDGVTCTVSAKGKSVDGFLHRFSDSDDRRLVAPGMTVFYPLEPLPRGAEVSVRWSYREPSGEPAEFAYVFFTR